jgi:hypothetical protein
MPVLDKKKNKDLTAIERVGRRTKKLEDQNFEALIKQVQSEYKVCFDHHSPRWEKQELRLKLYNNQKRDNDAVGDPLIFTIHQTILASLYDDKLSSTFEARTDGDEERAEQLNPMAEFDYEEMEKDQLDYEWDWDATFFGSGYMLMMEFSAEHTLPMPEVLDPMTVLVDPFAKSMQGIGKDNKGAAQYAGWEDQMTSRQLKNDGVYFNLARLGDGVTGDPIRARIDRNHEARNEAAGLQTINAGQQKIVGENRRINILNWFTWYRNKLVFVTLAENKTKVIRYEIIKERKTIPIIDRYLFPISHQLTGVSIPDLVEERVALALGLLPGEDAERRDTTLGHKVSDSPG